MFKRMANLIASILRLVDDHVLIIVSDGDIIRSILSFFVVLVLFIIEIVNNLLNLKCD
jgi:hypothetical protein